jgi:hypothetical protein
VSESESTGEDIESVDKRTVKGRLCLKPVVVARAPDKAAVRPATPPLQRVLETVLCPPSVVRKERAVDDNEPRTGTGPDSRRNESGREQQNEGGDKPMVQDRHER